MTFTAQDANMLGKMILLVVTISLGLALLWMAGKNVCTIDDINLPKVFANKTTTCDSELNKAVVYSLLDYANFMGATVCSGEKIGETGEGEPEKDNEK